MLLRLKNSMEEVIHFRHPQTQDFKLRSPSVSKLYLLCCICIFQGLAKNKHNCSDQLSVPYGAAILVPRQVGCSKYFQQVISHPHAKEFMTEKGPSVLRQTAVILNILSPTLVCTMGSFQFSVSWTWPSHSEFLDKNAILIRNHLRNLTPADNLYGHQILILISVSRSFWVLNVHQDEWI